MSTIPHAEWAAEINSKPLFITVGDQVTTGMFKKVTTYGVSTGKTEACSDTTVRRRYSDFEWLYNLLCARYPALVVAGMPPKGGLGGGGEAFIQRRIEGLDRFLKRCAQNYFLKADPSFVHFLTSDYDSSKWDTLKKTATSQSATNFLTRPVIDQYRAHGMELSSGAGAGNDESDEKIIASYTRLAKTAKAATGKLDGSLGALELAGINSDKASESLNQTMSTIADITEQAQGDSSIMKALSDFQTIAGSYSSSMGLAATHQNDQNALVLRHVLPATTEITLLFDEISKTMVRLTTLRKTLKSAESSKANAAAALAKLEASGKPDKGNKCHDAVAATAALTESLTQEVAVSVRVLCGFELNRVSSFFCKTLSMAIMKFAQEMEAKEKIMAQSWMSAATDLDTGDVEKNWKSTLVRLDLHGADMEGSWVSEFNPADLDNSSNI